MSDFSRISSDATAAQPVETEQGGFIARMGDRIAKFGTVAGAAGVTALAIGVIAGYPALVGMGALAGGAAIATLWGEAWQQNREYAELRAQAAERNGPQGPKPA